jgi:hypothetical protein
MPHTLGSLRWCSGPFRGFPRGRKSDSHAACERLKHACTSGPVIDRHWSGSLPMASRRRNWLPAPVSCCCQGAGLHERDQTGGTGIQTYRLALATGLHGRRRRASAQGQRQRPGGGQEAHRRCGSSPDRDQNCAGEAEEFHALDCADDGRGDGCRAHDRAAHLEGARSQAASDAHLPTLERPTLCREGARYRRALSQSARQGRGAVRR